MIHDHKLQILAIFITILVFQVTSVTINNGKVLLKVKGSSGDQQKLKIDIKSTSKSELQLTQSSKIELQATIQFSSPAFVPQFFAFRLRNTQFEGATQPVIATYSDVDDKFIAAVDLGNPSHIKALSGKYQLEIMISDDKLNENLRNNLANCNVVFRNAITELPKSQVSYSTQKLIQTSAPSTRIDPPQTFTLFVVLLIIIEFLMFLYGLVYLKANAGLFPSDFVGMIWNLLFISIMMGILAILLKFWINWTFITTFQYLSIIILPSVIIANYALVHIKKN